MTEQISESPSLSFDFLDSFTQDLENLDARGKALYKKLQQIPLEKLSSGGIQKVVDLLISLKSMLDPEETVKFTAEGAKKTPEFLAQELKISADFEQGMKENINEGKGFIDKLGDFISDPLGVVSAAVLLFLKPVRKHPLLFAAAVLTILSMSGNIGAFLNTLLSGASGFFDILDSVLKFFGIDIKGLMLEFVQWVSPYLAAAGLIGTKGGRKLSAKTIKETGKLAGKAFGAGGKAIGSSSFAMRALGVLGNIATKASGVLSAITPSKMGDGTLASPNAISNKQADDFWEKFFIDDPSTYSLKKKK